MPMRFGLQLWSQSTTWAGFRDAAGPALSFALNARADKPRSAAILSRHDSDAHARAL